MNTPMLDPDSIKTAQEIWAVPDGITNKSGSGTKDDPYRLGGYLDYLTAWIGNSARVHLAPGVYGMREFLFPDTWLLDAPAGDVTLKLADNAAPREGHWRMMRAKNGWASFVSISGIIFDGNWKNQPGIKTKNFKIEPMTIRALQTRIQGCTVRNWGSCGDGVNYFLEAMPLNATTVASGDPALYIPGKRGYEKVELTPSRIEILDNVVELPNFVGGGYCTGIFVRTNMGTDSGDRQPMETRTTEAALVRGNMVNVPGGICYGGGGTKETLGRSFNLSSPVCYSVPHRLALTSSTGFVVNMTVAYSVCSVSKTVRGSLNSAGRSRRLQVGSFWSTASRSTRAHRRPVVIEDSPRSTASLLDAHR